MKCSFCIVPKTRGRERYRSIDDIVAEVEKLSNNGIKEVTLLGQIVNAYGRGKFEKVDVSHLKRVQKQSETIGTVRNRFETVLNFSVFSWKLKFVILRLFFRDYCSLVFD